MKLLLLVAVCGLLLTGCGSRLHDSPHPARTSVDIEIGDGSGAGGSWSLTCEPTGGTLPLAARVCHDIALHPRAMLAPGGPSSTCLGALGPGWSVEASSGGRQTHVQGSWGCDWPASTAIGVYATAIKGDTSSLSKAESALRCAEGAMLRAQEATVWACRRGLWTPRLARLIRLAESTPRLAAVDASHLFPGAIGAQGCRIRGRGRLSGANHAGICSVEVTNEWSSPVVLLRERWSGAQGKNVAHIWHVMLQGFRVASVTESGAPAPQSG